MSDKMDWNSLEKEIQKCFRFGPPNGWLLGWDIDRGYSAISSVIAPLQVFNCTTFDYGFCNWFEVRLSERECGASWVLTIKLSFIALVYCLFWTYCENRTTGEVSEVIPSNCIAIEARAKKVLDGFELRELPPTWHLRIVEGVRLELSGNERVTADKCLFNDYEG